MSEVSERGVTTIYGTILPGGTLSNEIDSAGYSLPGLIYRGLTNGTLSFMVSDKDDAHGGVYVDLLASNGAAVTFGPTGTDGAVSHLVLEVLRPYRYFRVKTSIADATGALLAFPMKV